MSLLKIHYNIIETFLRQQVMKTDDGNESPLATKDKLESTLF